MGESKKFDGSPWSKHSASMIGLESFLQKESNSALETGIFFPKKDEPTIATDNQKAIVVSWR